MFSVISHLLRTYFLKQVKQYDLLTRRAKNNLEKNTLSTFPKDSKSSKNMKLPNAQSSGLRYVCPEN